MDERFGKLKGGWQKRMQWKGKLKTQKGRYWRKGKKLIKDCVEHGKGNCRRASKERVWKYNETKKMTVEEKK